MLFSIVTDASSMAAPAGSDCRPLPAGSARSPAPVRSDAGVVACVLAGDDKAYESLVRLYERPLRATCFAVLRNWHAAQDAAQEAFLDAYLHLRALRDPNRFGPWLLSIARRKAIALSQSIRVHAPLDAAAGAAAAEPTVRTTACSDESENLLVLIARLPEQERAVAMLRHIEGHDVAAIAQIRGSPVGTITKQLSRAHARLRKMLEHGERR
jgi:RNA polymerase sigma-70 factor, ECF subfamily